MAEQSNKPVDTGNAGNALDSNFSSKQQLNKQNNSAQSDSALDTGLNLSSTKSIQQPLKNSETTLNQTREKNTLNPYEDLKTPKQIQSGQKLNPLKLFQFKLNAGYSETILDKLVSHLAMLLSSIDSFFSGKMFSKKSKKTLRKSEREAQLEEFMNEQAKRAIGKKVIVDKKSKSDDDEVKLEKVENS